MRGFRVLGLEEMAAWIWLRGCRLSEGLSGSCGGKVVHLADYGGSPTFSGLGQIVRKDSMAEYHAPSQHMRDGHMPTDPTSSKSAAQS